MFKAVSEGDESAMMALLNADPMLLEKSDRDGMRPLAVAAQHGQLGALRLLVKEGAEISARDRTRSTALHWAAEGGHEEVVAFLLGQGAQADVEDTGGRTPLMLACAHGHVGVVRLLGQYMGTLALDEQDDRGNTGLHLAVDGGRTEVVNFLISQGADANRLFSDDGTTLLMRASANGHLGVVRALLQHMGTLTLHETDEDGKTALHWAVHEGWGQERMVRFLLVAGADSSIMDHELMTPRAVAEENEYAEIVAVFEVSECLMRSGRYLNYSTRGISFLIRIHSTNLLGLCACGCLSVVGKRVDAPLPPPPSHSSPQGIYDAA